jgi:hypothetical protein
MLSCSDSTRLPRIQKLKSETVTEAWFLPISSMLLFRMGSPPHLLARMHVKGQSRSAEKELSRSHAANHRPSHQLGMRDPTHWRYRTRKNRFETKRKNHRALGLLKKA